MRTRAGPEAVRRRTARLTRAGALLLLLSVDLGGGRAYADQPPAVWTVASGVALDLGQVGVWVQGGFPGASVDVVCGVGGGFELGARGAFDYAIQGLVDASAYYPGFTVQLLFRKQFIDAPGLKVAWRIDPGFFVSYDINRFHDNFYGIVLGLGLEAGLLVNPALSFNFSFSVPFWFGGGGEAGGVGIPLLFGAGVEFHPSAHVALTLTGKVGPTLAGSGRAGLTLYALGGVAFVF